MPSRRLDGDTVKVAASARNMSQYMTKTQDRSHILPQDRAFMAANAAPGTLSNSDRRDRKDFVTGDALAHSTKARQLRPH